MNTNSTALICNGAGRANRLQQEACTACCVWRRRGEKESLSRQVSTEGKKGWDMDKGREHYDDMMYMAAVVHGRRRINLTVRSERDRRKWTGRQGTGLSKWPPPRKKAPQLESWFASLGPHQSDPANLTPPPFCSTEYNVQPHTHTCPPKAQDLTLLPGCDQRATNVQSQYNDTQDRPFCLFFLTLCRSIDCRCKIHVNKHKTGGSCRDFVSGACACACTCTGDG